MVKFKQERTDIHSVDSIAIGDFIYKRYGGFIKPTWDIHNRLTGAFLCVSSSRGQIDILEALFQEQSK